ncbi:MAG TPA: carboxypeptidase-like regulatory domain-containing protein [Methanocella sp.]|jgi:hypothetical protein
MRVAVALLFVVAACAILFPCDGHCASGTTGNLSANATNLTCQSNGNSTNGAYEDYDDSGDNGGTPDNGGGQGPSGVGAITGVILSSSGSHAVPNANVVLYDESGNLVNVPENPQLSSNGTGNNGGSYMFYDVPYGIYNVTAEKGGVEFFAVVNLSSGTATANVVLPEYVETEPAYAEPLPPEALAPTPKPLRYFLPITVGKMPEPGPSNESLPYGLAALGGISALILFTRKNGRL